MSEVLAGISVVKLFQFEPLFQNRVAAHRKKEVAAMVRATTFKSCNAAAAWTSQMFVALATFGCHVAFADEPLTAAKIFSCLGRRHGQDRKSDSRSSRQGLFAAAHACILFVPSLRNSSCPE